MHQCYYCEQIFESKEKLYEHVEVHSDIERNKEVMNQKKQTLKKNQPAQPKLKKIEQRLEFIDSGADIIILASSNMDWVEILLEKSCDKTLTKGEVLHSLFHMIEVNENTLNHIQTDKRDFGPELEELKQTEIRDLDFHLKYYRSLVNYISSIPENKIIEK